MKEETMYEYDSDEDGEGRPCCTLTPDCARKITYCSCRSFFAAAVGTIFLILAATVIAFVVLVVIAFGIVRHVSITVDDAALSRFSLLVNNNNNSMPPKTSALAYNLSVALTMRNRNWVIDIENVKPLEAAYSFDGQQLGRRVMVADVGSKVRHKRTAAYRLSMSSDMAFVELDSANKFLEQNATGVFEVEIPLTGMFKYTLRTTRCSLEATCPLKLQLVPPGAPAPAAMFQKVKCKLAKPGKKC